jgi:hypothetical protein
VPSPAGSSYGTTIDIHRMKGRAIRDDGKTFLVQGVREVFEIFEAPNSDEEVGVAGKLVLIGRGLKGEDLKSNIEWFVVGGGGNA